MILIDGKKAAAELREELKKEVSDLKVKYNKAPGLTVILIGDLTPSQIYVRNKEKSANEVGLKSEVIKYPDAVEEKVVLEKIEELKQFIALETNDWEAIYNYLKLTSRTAAIKRNTNETRIQIDLNLDGNGKSNIDTGIAFFDHMLDQLSRHGHIDLNIKVEGDLEVDEHHTIEDTAIALGEVIASAIGNKFTKSIKDNYSEEKVVIICADIEDQIMGLDKSERESFMKEVGLDKTGLNQLIKEGYDLLNLDTFFTSGPEESRAWTIKKNTLAPKAASVIHTDFEKNFIRAEAVTCADFIKFGSSEKCKENGKLRIEGKDYVVKDGDVLYFRVNP